MELSTIIPHIEALIFASDKPLTSLDVVELINNAFGFMEERITLDQVESAMEGIREKYNAEFYPFEVRESGGGWQFLTKKEFHKTVGQLNGDKFLKRLSNAALETLAIIAYKQPITKGEVEAIRGVNSDYSVQKLLEKELIVIAGRSEELPGKPLVYTTSRTFMDYFGLNSVDDLPKIKEVLAEQSIQGTLINEGMRKSEVAENEGDTATEREALANLTVTDNGELMEYTLNREAEGEAKALMAKHSGANSDEDLPTNSEEEVNNTTENDEVITLPNSSGFAAFSDAEEDEATAQEEEQDEEEADHASDGMKPSGSISNQISAEDNDTLISGVDSKNEEDVADTDEDQISTEENEK